RIRRAIEHHAGFSYLGTLTVITLMIVGVILLGLIHEQASIATIIVAAILSLIPASDLALSVLNWDVTHFFEPRLLPKIDLSKGMPAEARTMVAVPVIFNDEATVTALIDRLEIAYLANQDEHLHFDLLGDFADAPSEEVPGDREILDAAMRGIEQLNERYNAGNPVRFHLFHLRRQSCPTE